MQEHIQKISFAEIRTALQKVCRGKERYFQTALTNVQMVKKFFSGQKVARSSAPSDCVIVQYAKGDTLVDRGMIVHPFFKKSVQFSYAQVPLGFIISGAVNVLKGGKGTKKLSEGDFLGLFETSDALLTKRKRNIGDWVLVADEPTTVLFFGASLLMKTQSANQHFRHYLIELARSDDVPQPITTLPLLDWVASHTTRSRLSDYVVVAHTHLLPNNLPFFRHLAYLVGFGKIFVLEKPYSTVKTTYRQLVHSGCEVIPVHMEPGAAYEFSVRKSLDILWSKVSEELQKSGFQHLLVIDDGGDLWTSLPWEKLKNISIAGVEQTQRGITRITGSQLRIPSIVSVASSGIKKEIESRFIARSVVLKMLNQKTLTAKMRVGILGNGSIGKAIAAYLEERGYAPCVYDPDTESDYRHAVGSIDALLNASDVILGTTGSDALKGIALERVHGRKILVSASSADVEFASLLKLARATKTPFATRKVKVHSKLTVEIINGGYPLNFDRKKDATPSEDIVLTRCLMYIAAMEAVTILGHGASKGKEYQLDTAAQKKTLEKWVDARKNSGVRKSEIDRIVGRSSADGDQGVPTVWLDD